METVVLKPWGQTSYEQALEKQRELTAAGRVGWLFFSCPPTITRGKRATASDVLASAARLAEQGVALIDVDRGGQVTYHGPGQLVGFPFGQLSDHVGDARGVRVFVERLKARLEGVVANYKTVAARQDGENVGVWTQEGDGRVAKIASIGLGFGRDGIRHGFALNLEARVLEGFTLINPCGESGASVSWLLATADETETALPSLVEALSR